MSEESTSSSASSLARDPGVWRFRVVYTVVLLAALVGIFVLSSRPPVLPDADAVNLYCFSGAEEEVRHGIIPAFRARHEAATGRRIEFITSFAGSGIVTRRIVREFPVDLAILSSPVDALYATRHGVRGRSEDLPHGGVFATSPLVIVVRPGNPLGIRGWADLVRDDVEVVHPDPVTSGLGVWSVLAQYESQARDSGSAAALAQLVGLRDRVVSWPESAVAARYVFDSGVGDALVTYAHEVAATPRREALEGDMVVPEPTILTEHVVVGVIGKERSRAQEAIVEAFLEFLWSDEATGIIREYGLWPPGSVPAEAAGMQLLTLEDLGGAAAARRQILEEVWFRRVRPEGT